MTDFIADASEWISQYREDTCSQTVVVKNNHSSTGVALQATVSSSQSETTSQGVKIQTQYTHFVMKWAALKNAGVDLQRGLIIEWKNKQFEMAFDKRALWDWNDPHHNDVVIMTIYKRDV